MAGRKEERKKEEREEGKREGGWKTLWSIGNFLRRQIQASIFLSLPKHNPYFSICYWPLYPHKLCLSHCCSTFLSYCWVSPLLFSKEQLWKDVNVNEIYKTLSLEALCSLSNTPIILLFNEPHHSTRNVPLGICHRFPGTEPEVNFSDASLLCLKFSLLIDPQLE